MQGRQQGRHWPLSLPAAPRPRATTSHGMSRHLGALLLRLEQSHGSIASLVGPASVGRVLTVDNLSTAALEDLFHHRVCAVRVPGFVPPEQAEALAEHLAGMDKVNWQVSSAEGLEETDVESIGMPYNMVVSDGPDGAGGGGGEAARDAYFADARALSSRFRSPVAPAMLTPIDKLRLELDDVWPDGANVAKDKRGRSHLAGAGRVMRPGGRWRDGFLHVDELDVLSEARGLFSANVYLRMPPTGGALHIWNVNVRTRWDYYRNAHTLSRLLVQDDAGQAHLRASFPAPLVLAPDPGDLILICAQRPHAACGFDEGMRVSMQTFVTHKKGDPLRVDA